MTKADMAEEKDVRVEVDGETGLDSLHRKVRDVYDLAHHRG